MYIFSGSDEGCEENETRWGDREGWRVNVGVSGGRW